jgi:hypothetical protein
MKVGPLRGLVGSLHIVAWLALLLFSRAYQNRSRSLEAAICRRCFVVNSQTGSATQRRVSRKRLSQVKENGNDSRTRPARSAESAALAW